MKLAVPDYPDPLEFLESREALAPEDPRANVDLKAHLECPEWKDLREESDLTVHQDPLVHPDPLVDLETEDPLDYPGQLARSDHEELKDPRANVENREYLARRDQSVLLVSLDLLDHWDPEANAEKKVHPESLEHPDWAAVPETRDRRDKPEPWDRLEDRDCRVNLAKLDLLDRLANAETAASLARRARSALRE